MSGTTEAIAWRLGLVMALVVVTSPAQALEMMPQAGHTETVRSVALSGDGRLALSGGESLTIWDVTSGALLKQHLVHGGQVNAIVTGPELAFSGGYDRILGWDLKTGRSVVTLRVPSGVSALAISPDGRWLASGGGMRVQLWNLKRGEVERTFDGHTPRVTAVAISPDGRTVVSAGGDYTLRIWNADTGASRVVETGRVSSTSVEPGVRRTTYEGHVVEALAFSPREAFFASGDASCLGRGRLRRREPSSQRQRRQIASPLGRSNRRRDP